MDDFYLGRFSEEQRQKIAAVLDAANPMPGEVVGGDSAGPEREAV